MGILRTKQCRDCARLLHIDRFYVKERRKHSTRYFSRCKKCYYKWVYARDKAQGYKWHGRKQKNGAARAALNNAVQSGRVIKPKRCEDCGAIPPKGKLDGHHHKGHGQPLVVRWLCEKCHGAIHAA